jgi:hypothetical protein
MRMNSDDRDNRLIINKSLVSMAHEMRSSVAIETKWGAGEQNGISYYS